MRIFLSDTSTNLLPTERRIKEKNKLETSWQCYYHYHFTVVTLLYTVAVEYLYMLEFFETGRSTL